MLFKKKQLDQPKQPNWTITSKCLELICECAKSTHPNEFGALLKIQEPHTTTITEIILLPGTISGNTHAIFRLHMRPIDFSIVGTVHSHPSPYPFPSQADISLFNHYGKIHIISAYPYTSDTWASYDYKGNKQKINII